MIVLMKNDLLLQIIKDALSKTTNKNSSVSQRAFAKRIGLSSGSLSEVLSGKRGLSLNKAKAVLEKLGYSEEEQNNILKFEPLVRHKKNRQYKKISQDLFDQILEWQNFAILSLLKTKGFKSDIQWISQRLNIEKSTTQKSIDKLKSIGLIVEQNGEFHLNQENVETLDNISCEAIKKSHLQDLELFKNKITTTDVDCRDYSSITMSFDSKKLPLVKAAIRQFQEQIAELCETKSAEEVYKLSVYLAPLTVVTKCDE